MTSGHIDGLRYILGLLISASDLNYSMPQNPKKKDIHTKKSLELFQMIFNNFIQIIMKLVREVFVFGIKINFNLIKIFNG